MNKILTILMMLFTMIVSAQTKDYKAFKKYVPMGYSLNEVIKGDLNKDGQEDIVLIIKGTDKDMLLPNQWDTDIVDKNRRGIIILFKKGDSYEVAVKNYSCFSSENEDGGVYYAPELYFEIKNSILYINYAHGRYGNWGYVFRYQNSDMELIGYNSHSNRGPIALSEVSINFSTKKRLDRENLNADKGDDLEEKFVDTWSTIDLPKRIKLSEIKDFTGLYF
ncbi:MAG: hypothetical protein ACRCVU_18290 [Flavobacterium sp.]